MGIIGQPIAINNFIGTRSVPPRSIPDGVSEITFTFDGGFDDPALEVDLAIQQSNDGGQTWFTPVSAQMFGVTGGPVNKQGQPIPFSVGGTFEPGTSRLAQATAVVSGARLTTTLTINVS